SHSRVCLDALRDELGIQYEGRRQGTLQVFRTQQQLDAAGQDMKVLGEAGIHYELLGRDELEQAEPALARSKHKLMGGLRTPNDETGDCNLFTTQLAAEAVKLGVTFRYGTTIKALHADGSGITGVETDAGL